MLTRQAATVELRIAGKLRKDGRVLSVSQVLGGGQVNSATFLLVRDGSQPNGIMQDTSLGKITTDDLVEVYRRDINGRRERIHRGRLVKSTVRVSGSGEEVVYKSRLDPHLYSDPLLTAPFAIYPGRLGFRSLDVEEIHFNPIVQQTAWPNQLKIGNDRVFLDADSAPQGTITKGVFLPGQKFWGLAEAVDFLCRLLNTKQDVVNPSLAALTASLGNDRGLLRGVRIKSGTDLDDALESILEPLGWQWWIDQDSRSFRFKKRGDPTPAMKIEMGRWGQQPRSTDAYDVSLSFDRGDQSCTQVRVLGDFEVVEGTFELHPAWDPAYDDTPDEELISDSEQIKANPDLERVWKDWVLNESGDYSALRAGIPQFNARNLFDHPEFLPGKRRKFLPLVTQHKLDDTPSGRFESTWIEWHDGSGWRPISELNVRPQLLKNEAGIRLSGIGKPPHQLRDRVRGVGANWHVFGVIKIRITASLQSERRVQAARVGGQVLRVGRERVISKPRDFKLRRLQLLGPHASIFAGDVFAKAKGSTSRDDTAACRALATEVVESWSQATAAGRLKINGIDWSLRPLGRPVSELAPRGIKLHVDDLGRKAPDVTSVTYDIESQTTIISIDTHKRKRP